ncbi:MAG: alpha/beta fold hydrolase [Chloroflexi bacterium]|nr:alpha/beta fold hydrolase [Chloroflexota bacterium]
MTRHVHLDPSAFFLEGGPVGILLIHGFTGSPPEMRLVGDYFHQRGLTVSGPLLPGHGTDVDDVNRRRWSEWTAHVERALSDLQSRCSTVFVGGLSMGALLTLYLGARPPEVSGLMAYSPAILVANRLIYLTPVLKHFISKRGPTGESDLTDPEADSRLWSYEEQPVRAAHELLKLQRVVRRLLPAVKQPLLIIQSTGDTTIDPRCGQIIYGEAGSTDRELVWLHNSGHCITVDGEWESVAEKTYEFIQAHQ